MTTAEPTRADRADPDPDSAPDGLGGLEDLEVDSAASRNGDGNGKANGDGDGTADGEADGDGDRADARDGSVGDGSGDDGDRDSPSRIVLPAQRPASAASTAAAAAAAAGSTHPAPAVRAEQAPRRKRRYTVMAATGLAAVTHILWFFFFANSGGDLAAQDAWAEFVGRHPDSAYNLAWYGGMHPVSYSVVSPYLMSLLGVRSTMMIAGTLSAALTALILVRVRAVRNPLACSVAGVFAFLCNALSGRVTFGLGMMFAVGAVAAVFCWPHRWRRKRWAKAVVAAPLAGLATACSPVAGLFLGVAAAALFLNRRRPGAYALGLAPVAVVALSSWLFPSRARSRWPSARRRCRCSSAY